MCRCETVFWCCLILGGRGWPGDILRAARGPRAPRRQPCTNGQPAPPPRANAHPLPPAPAPIPQGCSLAGSGLPVVTIKYWGTVNETCTCGCSGSTPDTCTANPICAGPVPTTYAYVADLGTNLVSVCPVLPTGALGTCTLSNGSGTFNSPTGPAVAGGYLYACNGNTVSICPITSPSGTLGTCASTTGSGTFSSPYFVVVASGYAHVTNAVTNTVSICPVVATGALGTCLTSTAGGTLSAPRGIARPGNGYAYISNYGSNLVSVCQDSGAALTSCSTTSGGGAFNGPSGLAVAGAYLYVTNQNTNTVTTCPLTSPNVLGPCTTRSGFAGPTGVTIFRGQAYVTNLASNTVSYCPLVSGGAALGPCSTSAGSFSSPFGIAFATF